MFCLAIMYAFMLIVISEEHVGPESRRITSLKKVSEANLSREWTRSYKAQARERSW